MSIQRLAACHSEVLAGRLHDVSLAVTGEARPPVSCPPLDSQPVPLPGGVAQCGSHSSHGGAHGSLQHGHPCLFLSPQPLKQELATHFSDWKAEAWGSLTSNLWVLKQSESYVPICHSPALSSVLRMPQEGRSVLGQISNFWAVVTFPKFFLLWG